MLDVSEPPHILVTGCRPRMLKHFSRTRAVASQSRMRPVLTCSEIVDWTSIKHKADGFACRIADRSSSSLFIFLKSMIVT